MAVAGYLGKRVSVFYNDFNSVSAKHGVCTSNSVEEIILDNKIVIPKSRVVRIEIGGTS